MGFEVKIVKIHLPIEWSLPYQITLFSILILGIAVKSEKCYKNININMGHHIINKRNLLCVLVYFSVAFLQFIWPLLLVIFKVFDFGLIGMVPINDITVGGTFIVNNRPALHVLVIVIHVDIPLRVSDPGRFHAAVHLTGSKEVSHVLTGDNTKLQCFVHTLSLDKT